MSSIYTHCPHCEYPIVVTMLEVSYPRHCRQCGQTYIPADAFGAIAPETKQKSHKDQRASLRSRIRKTLQNRMIK